MRILGPSLTLALSLSLAAPVAALSCSLAFTVEVTRGVGFIPPGTQLAGTADFVTSGETFRQEGGSMAHYATGQMTLDTDIVGTVWTLITTSQGSAADLVGVYANDVDGFSFAGAEFDGPMALTLFGDPGTRATNAPPETQAEWDNMNLRRAFSLHADSDFLAGNVLDLTVACD